MLPATPTKLGRYEILDEIGKGAMGVVYLARDPLIGRLVALKTFRIGYSVKDHEAEQFRARFMREAQSAGILSHPGIVTVHDVVEEGEDGLAFIAMEYVRGTNLKAVLQGEAPLGLPFVNEVVRQIAEALDYAHSRGVVHRDVKPANILITADDRVKITDFGIARLDTSNLTQEGQLLGTPNYMAPEQIQGRDVDHRADIFSLGIVLYEMLTRHKPFQGENLTVVSHRIVYDEFTPPEQYVRNLRPEVRAVLSRALEKDPARRYQRARELAEDLRRAAGEVAPPAPDDLNETQGFALAPVPALEAVPAVPAAAEGRGGDSALGTLRLSPRRVTIFGGLAAAATALTIAAAILWLGWSGRPLRESVRPDHSGQVLALVREGHHHLRAGRPAVAAAYYDRAARLAPERGGLRRLREEALQKAREFNRLVLQEGVFQAHLTAGRQAFAGGRWDEAMASADAALALDSGSEEARQLRADAEAGAARAAKRQERAARLPRPVAQVAEVVPSPAPAPAEPGPAPAAAPEETKVHVRFYSHLPEGVLMVYLDGRKLVQSPFSFHEKTGFLRSRPGKGWVERTVRVPPGTANFRIYVTPAGRGALVFNVSGNFPEGATRQLEAQLSESGKLTAELK